MNSIFRHFSTKQLVLVGLAIPLLCTLLIGWLQYKAVTDMNDTRGAMRHIRAGQIALATFRYALSDAESCQFRYILTHNDANLSLYHTLMAQATDQFEVMREMSTENDYLRQFFSQLEPLVKAKEEATDQSLAMEQSGNHAGALQIVSAEDSRQNMLDIEAGVDNMQKVELEMLRATQGAFAHNFKVATALSVASTAVSLGCIACILLLLRRLARLQSEVTLGAVSEMIKYQDGTLTIEEYLRRRNLALSVHGEAQIEAEKLLGQIERRKPRTATTRVRLSPGPDGGSTTLTQENQPPRP
jgi:CHASE3 domain sensor protein